MGDGSPGCHFVDYIGSSFPVSFGTCAEVPTLGATPEATCDSLTTALLSLSLDLSEQIFIQTSKSQDRPANALVGPQELPDSNLSWSGTEGPPTRMVGCDLDPNHSQRRPHVTQSSPTQRGALHGDVCASGNRQVEAAHAYPTDAKEREKARRKKREAQGETITVKKRKKVVENHHDDCGDDLSSLTGCVFSHLNTDDTEDEFLDHDAEHAMLSYLGAHAHVYPVDLASVAQAQPGDALLGRDPRAKPAKESSCPGCRHFRARNDWEHNRVIGECSYPHDHPWIPDCPACQRRAPRLHEDHTYEHDKCRWATASMRAGGKRKRGEPHEPQPPAHEDPTVGAPIRADGQELGQRGEERVAQADREAAAAAGPVVQEGGASSSGGNRQVEARERAGRGPDQDQRVRRVFRDQGDNPERPSDWTNFDIGRVVRLFRTDQPGAIRLSLRKLHVRWWHASISVLTKFLIVWVYHNEFWT